MTSRFTPIDGLDGVYTARLGKLSCTALRLVDGSLCLYSPVAGLEKTLAGQANEIGAASALFAPNHYHNKGLAGHTRAFPTAVLYCSDTARPRLSKTTGLDFDASVKLNAALPTRVTMHEPDGLKTGEVWMVVNSGADCALIVTDAFGSLARPPGEFGQEATLLRGFPRYGIEDAGAYKTWASGILSETAPTILLPCHGSPVRSPDLATQLIGLLDGEF